MMYRVIVKYYYFDFTDLQEACDFALKSKDAYVPEDKGDDPNVFVFLMRRLYLMVEKINKIIEEINKADIPQGDYMDLEEVWNILRDEDLSFNDVLEGLVKVTNALLNIRAIINE